MPAPQPTAKTPSGRSIHFVTVFTDGVDGGNPCPIVVDADGMTDDEMKRVSATYGHEASFVHSPSPAGTADGCLARLRFFVPANEMEMCGHGTLGTLWLLRELGVWNTDTAQIETLSGVVHVRFEDGRIDVGQEEGVVSRVDEAFVPRIAGVLGLDVSDIDDLGVSNAKTSRTKTLVPLKSVDRLQAIDSAKLDADAVRELCDDLDSTGLYPFAVGSPAPLEIHARQFPRSSGYVEDAATGVAAAATLYGALEYGLLKDDDAVMVVRQGYAMGRPSAIRVSLREKGRPGAGLWMSGAVEAAHFEPRSD